MAEIAQGDIYWVRANDLDIEGHEQQKNRPYVVVSRTRINKLGKNVVGVPLSTVIEKACAHRVLIPIHHMMTEPGSTRELKASVALTDHIRVLDSARFELPRMGKLSDTAIRGLEVGLAFLFDIR
jgi:mRNA-degrading endonuclease toxin of MazEF toxin-antitoxin module